MITLVTIPTKDAPGDLITKYDPIRVRQYQNMEEAKTYGVDFTVRYQGRHFTAGGSYSYLDTEANQYDSEKEQMVKVTIDGMAHHKANLYVTWNHDFSKRYNMADSPASAIIRLMAMARATSSGDSPPTTR